MQNANNESAVRMYEFDRCMTVKELKAILHDWPDFDKDGSPSEVWIETGPCNASRVIRLVPDGGTGIHLESGAFDSMDDAAVPKWYS
jgi:hypothetical protein